MHGTGKIPCLKNSSDTAAIGSSNRPIQVPYIIGNSNYTVQRKHYYYFGVILKIDLLTG
jgi:hypothetical protein